MILNANRLRLFVGSRGAPNLIAFNNNEKLVVFDSFVFFVFASCYDVGALDASLGMKAQLALGRSWPLASHLPGAPASGLTEKKMMMK